MQIRKTTVEKIEEAKAKITQYETHMKKLLQKQKQDERKAKMKRQCSRAELIEKLLPDTITLTHEQFKAFLDRTAANDFGRRTLTNIVKGNVAVATPKVAEATLQAESNNTEKKTLDQQQQT